VTRLINKYTEGIEIASIDKYERVGRNLYKYHGTYYRLYAQGTTHNRLWLIYPELVESIVEVWNQYLSGDIWGYCIKDSSGEVLDSCFGFYGFDYCKSEAIEAAKGLIVPENCQLKLPLMVSA
jgi:hypothetical protein